MTTPTTVTLMRQRMNEVLAARRMIPGSQVSHIRAFKRFASGQHSTFRGSWELTNCHCSFCSKREASRATARWLIRKHAKTPNYQ